jgi:thiamine-phosphate pyrophosphorylase
LSQLPHPPFLCVITDDGLPTDRIVAAVEAACIAVRPIVVQLRARNRGGRELHDLAATLRAITSAHRCLLIVNDRLDVALAVGADGVHLPAAGVPAALVRAAVDRRSRGSGRLLVGASVHSVAEIRASAPFVDYFQFGPVFATPSKARYGAPQGIAALGAAVAAATASRDAHRPVVAVGGIARTNAHLPGEVGAAGVAVIRAVMRATDPGGAAASLVESLTRRPA